MVIAVSDKSIAGIKGDVSGGNRRADVALVHFLIYGRVKRHLSMFQRQKRWNVETSKRQKNETSTFFSAL